MVRFILLAEKISDHQDDENHVLAITGLVGNGPLNIFATCSYDTTVKIWDGLDNTLLREIPCFEIVWSLCFQNERGDLLAGLQNDIVLIRVQDYIPYALQRYIIDQEFRDDPLEFSLMFDPLLDFWEIYLDALEEADDQDAIKNWHTERE